MNLRVRLEPDHPHYGCDPASWAWRPVSCDGCGREHICTPDDDHYCEMRSRRHVCEDCLAAGLPVCTVLVADPIRREKKDHGPS